MMISHVLVGLGLQSLLLNPLGGLASWPGALSPGWSPAASAEMPLQDSVGTPVLDSVRNDLARGRSWHAAQRLRSAFPGGPDGRPELLRLFAEAEAGWGNWPEVVALLQAPLEAGEMEGFRAWYLLGRALEERGAWAEAAVAYHNATLDSTGEPPLDQVAVRTRLVRMESRSGRFAEAGSEIRELESEDPLVSGWTALEVAETAAETGAWAETVEILSLVSTSEIQSLGWDLPARALLAAGDSTGAEVAYWMSLTSLASSRSRAAAWERIGTLRLSRGDSAGARGAYHQVFRSSGAGSATRGAAEMLVRLGFDSVEVALAAAEALAAAGRSKDALKAYEAYGTLLGGSPAPDVLLDMARAYLGSGDRATAVTIAGDLEGSPDPGIGAPALVLEVAALRGLGRVGDARAAEDRLVQAFPQRPEALEVVFQRARASEDRGDVEGALLGFESTVRMSPSQNRAGEARMRMAQLLLSAGRREEALDVYEAYLQDFPDGRRADEAAFWAARTLLELARGEEAEMILSELVARFPLSFYSVQGERLRGRSFVPVLQESIDSLPLPAILGKGLATIDHLRLAGSDRGVAWMVGYLAERLRAQEDPALRRRGLLRFALELDTRGLTREGINLGWEVQRDGQPWDRNLLQAIYPFPYRAIVEAEAEEKSLDPFLMAGLIRQESAFWVQARSAADARGLMQVLPSTGAELARAVGPRPFRADDHLNRAEINIHLGVAFFSDLVRRFGDNLPVLLSAYNAGPTRARRWREFPEAADTELFVERIPFVETRGYVKNVLANRAIYSWLYGGSTPADSPEGRRQ